MAPCSVVGGKSDRANACARSALEIVPFTRIGHRYSVVDVLAAIVPCARSFGSKIRTTRSISYFGGQSSLPMSL